MHSKTANVCSRTNESCEKHEIVTVVMRVGEYRKLKQLGGPRPDQIHMALHHYLGIVRELGWQSNIKSMARMYENVTSYQCRLRKSICDEIRHLKGRFDDHTIEALRLYLR
ncbi:hypothetical protein [Desulfomonile tiedjei]|uniref:Uncharacterized protein n=1 Tax=Desulfomonile tiedjei (strain ATCC 49306 / DSM 6799 / DCB-1) TaxID=706587 RepID=I4C0K4_DESTA|nr:hypothetical protein [Desulfomonile tiedjei]AFM23095.1 hypothetical protein Desti_0358 [Desulfomonile tiedjei DSM 6799]